MEKHIDQKDLLPHTGLYVVPSALSNFCVRQDCPTHEAGAWVPPHVGLMQDIPHGKALSHGLYLNQAHAWLHLTRAFVHVKLMAKGFTYHRYIWYLVSCVLWWNQAFDETLHPPQSGFSRICNCWRWIEYCPSLYFHESDFIWLNWVFHRQVAIPAKPAPSMDGTLLDSDLDEPQLSWYWIPPW